MGCGLAHKTKMTITSLNHIYQKTPSGRLSLINPQQNQQRKDFEKCISEQSWGRVLDYLKYDEIRETGKTSKMFNHISKQNFILLKFFKNRGSVVNPKGFFSGFEQNFVSTYKTSFVSFSELKRTETFASLSIIDSSREIQACSWA